MRPIGIPAFGTFDFQKEETQLRVGSQLRSTKSRWRLLTGKCTTHKRVGSQCACGVLRVRVDLPKFINTMYGGLPVATRLVGVTHKKCEDTCEYQDVPEERSG